MYRILPTICILVFSFTSFAAERVSVGLLLPTNSSADTNSSRWEHLIPHIVSSALREISAVRLVPETSIDFAYNELKLKPGQTLDDTQMKRLGETAEAAWVVWIDYHWRGGEWKLTTKVMNVATGRQSKPLDSSSADLWDAFSEMNSRILERLDVKLSKEKELHLRERPTTSIEAFRLLSTAYAASDNGEVGQEIENDLRQALKLDPHFSWAQSFLAYLLITEGRCEEAGELAKKVILAQPNRAGIHNTLGWALLCNDLSNLAREEFNRAVQLDPDFFGPYSGLGQLERVAGNMPEAIKDEKKAESLEPCNSRIRMRLAQMYGESGNLEQTLIELGAAERFDTGKDVYLDRDLATAYSQLNNYPKALEHFRRFLQKAAKAGVPSAEIKDARDRLAESEIRLKPQYVTNPIIQPYTPTELDNLLRAKLSPNEHALITNPILCTGEMKKWAEQLVGDARTDEEKAKRLFDALTHRLNLSDPVGIRTALQVFRDWKDTKATFSCGEDTVLFIALGRAVGLPVYFVWVEKDYADNYVNHMCAGVLLDGKALLADPTYGFFGVPHKEYEFCNDVQMIGVWLAQGGKADMLPSLKVADKLAPENPVVRFNLVLALSNAGQQKEANQILTAGRKAGLREYLQLYLDGIIAAKEARFDAAAESLLKSVKLAPMFPEGRLLLAQVLANQGRYKESKEEYRLFLQGYARQDLAIKAREELAKVNEQLRESK
jgi:tetratricopeptide (TPR) repeat protein